MALFLTALAAIGGASLLKKLDVENNDKSIFLDSNLYELKSISERIDRNLESGLKNCNNTLKKLHNVNKSVVDTTFKNFVNIAENIANVELNDELLEIHKVKLNFSLENNLSLKNEYASRNKFKIAVTNMLLPGSYLISQAIYSAKLDVQLAESHAEIAKVKALCEVAKREIAKMRSISNLAESAIATTETLKELGDRAIENLIFVTQSKGYDYKNFSEEDKNSVWLTFKLMSALNELINMEILTESGNISAKFRKFVGDINEDYIEA